MSAVAPSQIELTDPRPYARGEETPLVALAAASLAGAPGARRSLVALARRHLAARDDDAMHAAFAAAPGYGVRLRLREALKEAIEEPDADSEDANGLMVRAFAIPVLFVTGGRPGAVISGVVPDVAEVSALLKQHKALGQTENFGLAPALATAETLEGIRPSTLYRWTRSVTDGTAAAAREVAGTDIVVDAAEEQVHLRFLIGAGICPAQGLSVAESAARIDAWGMPVTRALAAQLGLEGLSLLPLPRPPKSLMLAAQAGCTMWQEARFTLLASSVLRKMRGAVGEPVAVIATHEGGELRISFSSPFDESVRHGFRWPLSQFDDLGAVVGTVLSLLHDCRVHDIRVVPGLQPDRDAATGEHLLLSVHDLGPSGATWR